MGQHKYIRQSGILNTEKNWFYSSILIGINDDCFIWVGSIKNNGYGMFKTLSKKWVNAHRYSYMLFNGKINDGLCVLHKCDNRKCVRPDHLFLGTKKDNTADMILKNRNGKKGAVGEKNCKAKLNINDILQIRKLYAKGMNCTNISSIYKVSISTIDRIVKKIYWKHI